MFLIPTDDEFLYDHFRDDTWANMMKTGHDLGWDARPDLIELSPEDEKLREELWHEMGNPSKALRGQLIQVLQEGVLHILGDEPSLTRIPVGLVPARQLNACAARTPSGGAAILLDHGVIVNLSLWISPRNHLAILRGAFQAWG
jgi:hypothetical protein